MLSRDLTKRAKLRGRCAMTHFFAPEPAPNAAGLAAKKKKIAAEHLKPLGKGEARNEKNRLLSKLCRSCTFF